MFEEMHADGVEPCLMTYNTLIAGCVRAEHPDEAMSVFKMMEERNIKRDQVTFIWPTTTVVMSDVSLVVPVFLCLTLSWALRGNGTP